MRPWVPLLDGDARERALEHAEQAATDLLNIATDDPSLAGGAGGMALLPAYQAEVTGEQRHTAAAVTLLERALGLLPVDEQTAALYSGRLGVAWVVAHLDGRVIDVGDDDPNDGMDLALVRLLESEPGDEFDLISGLVGIGVYALERLPRPAAEDTASLVVEHLARLARPEDPGLAWFTEPELARTEDGYWNLGVAHGVPGVIAFLAPARSAGIAPETTGPLLEGATSWLVAQRSPVGAPTCFDAWIRPGGEHAPSRTAWCYGDPGVAAALLAAGRREEAVATARTAAARSIEESGVVDAGLCHGAAGLGHLFNRLWQATGDPVLRTAAISWFERAFELPTPEAGFLEGDTGVGLALLAAATDVEPGWDRLLLLS